MRGRDVACKAFRLKDGTNKASTPSVPRGFSVWPAASRSLALLILVLFLVLISVFLNSVKMEFRKIKTREQDKDEE
jgi:hypothetical protein